MAQPPPDRRRSPIRRLLEIMARLRGPDGCPWDREQDHRSLRYHAVEEVYELLDAIEAGDDHELREELGDLLLQVVFHAQMASERGAFDFNDVVRGLVEKLIHRHPHVFGDAEARTAAAVWEQWDRLKHREKAGTARERHSALDGIPRHLPALLRAQKLWKKACRAHLVETPPPIPAELAQTAKNDLPQAVARQLFALACLCQENGWSAEALLREECGRREREWRRLEAARQAGNADKKDA
ncbi:MAG: MazG family protein [Verrucomicrobia bacterium]|nr:MAG: MazG family protein [Verrucomicrobiota bacterium]